MAEPIGTRRVSCSAHDGPYQCRAHKNLTAVLIDTSLYGMRHRNLVLPNFLVVMLCPKHFVMRIAGRATEKQVSRG